jgi:F420-dependent oxidoreductase-like protein
MKLGLHAGYWGLGTTGPEQVEMAKAAEQLGFDSVWTAEAYGSDTATMLAWFAVETERIKIGSGIFQIPGRTPAMTAMTASTLDNISNGRMLCGIGVSGPQVSEGWHGVPFRKPLARTREYVEILRMAFAHEKVSYDGEFYKLPLPDGPGKPLKLIVPPIQERLPIYIAAIGPKNTALTAEIADGWIPTIFSPEQMDTYRPSLEQGAAKGGRSLDDFDVAPMVSLAIHDDHDKARDLMRPFLALYIGGMGSRDKNFYAQLVTRYGYGDEAKQIQDLYLAGKKDEAMAAVPAELIDQVALAGPKEFVAERLAAYERAGVGTLMISPVAYTLDERLRMMTEVAELAKLPSAAA